MITYSGSLGSSPTRSSAASIAIEPSCVASYFARPPPRRPKGVRTAATMTERWTTLMEQQAKAAGKSPQEFQAEAEKAYPLGRIGHSEDIADLVCFLVSARASFITGICITVDGGATRGVYP